MTIYSHKAIFYKLPHITKFYLYTLTLFKKKFLFLYVKNQKKKTYLYFIPLYILLVYSITSSFFFFFHAINLFIYIFELAKKIQ